MLILWVFLNFYSKFLIISLSEDADLTFIKKIGSAEMNIFRKKYK